MRIDELRSNPEKNPKVSIIDVIKKYKDDQSVFVTFSSVNKLGINPSSSFNTPLGIYAYPVYLLWRLRRSKLLNNKDFDLRDVIPFAGNRPYAVFFRYERGANILTEVVDRSYDSKWDGSGQMNYSKDDLRRDLEQLNPLIEERGARESVDVFLSAKLSSPVAKLWHSTFVIKKNPKEWNTIFRSLGIDGIVDEGEGLIHSNEYWQAVFFTAKYLKLVEVAKNRTYNFNTRAVVYHQFDKFISGFGTEPEEIADNIWRAALKFRAKVDNLHLTNALYFLFMDYLDTKGISYDNNGGLIWNCVSKWSFGKNDIKRLHDDKFK